MPAARWWAWPPCDRRAAFIGPQRQQGARGTTELVDAQNNGFDITRPSREWSCRFALRLWSQNRTVMLIGGVLHGRAALGQ